MQPSANTAGSARPDGFEFGDAFTVAVRSVLPQVAAKRLTHAFDYRGPAALVVADPVALQCSLYRLLCATIDIVDSGFVIFDAEVSRGVPGGVMVTVKAAGTGTLAPDATIDAVLERLLLAERSPHAMPGTPRLRRAFDRCPRTGAAIEFVSLPTQGVLFQWELSLSAVAIDDAQPDAGEARAWIVDPQGSAAESLVHRLQRLGWATQRLHSPRQAALRLAEMPPGQARPALVVVVETDGVTPEDAQRLVPLLPVQTRVVFGALAGSHAWQEAAAVPDVEIEAVPFSPGDLARWTVPVADYAQAASGLTRPAPLLLADRPPLLVVDDDEVNTIIAAGLAESLGYDVQVARSGFEAIEACRFAAPTVVLMDLSMPGMDGLETARRLRDMQRSGAIPPFRIVALTADSNLRQRCIEAGMDGYLTKPLLRDTLSAELRRVRAGFEVRPAA